MLEVGMLEEPLDEGRIFCQTVAEAYELLSVKIQQCPGPDERRIHPEEDLLNVRGILLETAYNLLDKGDSPVRGRRLDDDGEVITLLKGCEALRECDQGMAGRNEAQPAGLEVELQGREPDRSEGEGKGGSQDEVPPG